MPRRELDVSDLPTVVFGHRSIIWLGTIGMMMIEATVFALVVASYFYLRTRSNGWPPGLQPPNLLFGTANTLLFLASLFPNAWTKKRGEAGDLPGVQIGLTMMVLLGLGNIALRWFEFRNLNSTWDANAYASVTWTLLGLHTVHLLTDWFDTVVLAVLMFCGLAEGKRFMDVSENSDYWYFVVFTWLPIYAVLYFAPRIL
jgi:cytochrome c oxidase subunit I+III